MLHTDPDEIDRALGYPKRNFHDFTLIERISAYAFIGLLFGLGAVRVLQ